MKSTLFAVTLGLSLSLCAMPHPIEAQDSTAAQKPAANAFNKETIVYVSDFELDAQNVQVDQGSAVGQNRPGLIERRSKREQKDPEAQAKKLVDTMSTSLVSDLQKAGYNAIRLTPGQTNPTVGALVHGVFTEVDEGSRIHRAVIGFGSGEATMSLYVTLSDLAHPNVPLYNSTDSSDSGKKPGAVITMNPYAAAIKFVMEKNAPEKTVKKTAEQITKELTTQLQQAGAVPTPKK